MARIRTIKPEFWTDSKTGTLSDRAARLFIGMLNFSDDYGVLEFDLAAIKAKVLPYIDGGYAEVVGKPLLDELLPKGLLTIFCYTEEDEQPMRQYLFIANFSKHQKIDRPSPPLIRGWMKGDTPESFSERSTSNLRVIVEPSLSDRCGKGMEGNVREGKGSTPLAPSGPKNGTGSKPKWSRQVSWCEETGRFNGISDELLESWRKTYPALNIPLKLMKMDEWLKSNPTKKKKNYYRFITNWLGRDQEKGF